MGIEGQYGKWLKQQYPKAFINTQKSGHGQNRQSARQSVNHLYIDLNAFLHKIPLHAFKSEKSICLSLFSCLTRVIKQYDVNKSIYIAMDGVAPVSKFFVQRLGREHKIMLDIRKNAVGQKSKGVVFTPYTRIMNQTALWLEYYAFKHLLRAKYAGLCMYIDSALIAGEGEHKILKHLRSLSTVAGGNKKFPSNRQQDLKQESVAIVGTDSDIYVQLMMNSQLLDRFSDVYFDNPTMFPDKSTLGRFSLKSFKQELAIDMRNKCQNPIDSDSLLKDFAALSLLVGNDYLPKVRGLKINSLYDGYIKFRNQKDSVQQQLRVWDAKKQCFNIQHLKTICTIVSKSFSKYALEKLRFVGPQAEEDSIEEELEVEDNVTIDLEDSPPSDTDNDEQEALSNLPAEEDDDQNNDMNNQQSQSNPLDVIDDACLLTNYIKDNKLWYKPDLPAYLQGLNFVGKVMSTGQVPCNSFEYRPRMGISLLDIIECQDMKAKECNTRQKLDGLNHVMGHVALIPFIPLVTDHLFDSGQAKIAIKLTQTLMSRMQTDGVDYSDGTLPAELLSKTLVEVSEQFSDSDSLHCKSHYGILKFTRKWSKDNGKLVNMPSNVPVPKVVFEDNSQSLEAIYIQGDSHNIYRQELLSKYNNKA
ncbi:hypothetical protein MP228_003568 [Amoeboaphelidium protococcarum]|nr:hypothetical protein MP228_003568 [Amoeboaphelidium protococcarum]